MHLCLTCWDLRCYVDILWANFVSIPLLQLHSNWGPHDKEVLMESRLHLDVYFHSWTPYQLSFVKISSLNDPGHDFPKVKEEAPSFVNQTTCEESENDFHFWVGRLTFCLKWWTLEETLSLVKKDFSWPFSLRFRLSFWQSSSKELSQPSSQPRVVIGLHVFNAFSDVDAEVGDMMTVAQSQGRLMTFSWHTEFEHFTPRPNLGKLQRRGCVGFETTGEGW